MHKIYTCEWITYFSCCALAKDATEIADKVIFCFLFFHSTFWTGNWKKRKEKKKRCNTNAAEILLLHIFFILFSRILNEMKWNSFGRKKKLLLPMNAWECILVDPAVIEFPSISKFEDQNCTWEMRKSNCRLCCAPHSIFSINTHTHNKNSNQF